MASACLLLSQSSLLRRLGLRFLLGRFLGRLLRLLLHALGCRLGLFGLLTALRFSLGLGASLGFTLFGSLLVREHFALGILFGLFL